MDSLEAEPTRRNKSGSSSASAASESSEFHILQPVTRRRALRRFGVRFAINTRLPLRGPIYVSLLVHSHSGDLVFSGG